MSRSAGGVLTRVFAAVAAAGWFHAQSAGPRARFAFRQAEVSLIADTTSGFAVVVEPSASTKEGKEEQGLVWLRFHPDSVLDWLNSAAAVLTAPVPNGPAEGIQWSRTLNALSGAGALAVGRERKKGVLQKTHWIAIGDSAAGWRIDVTAEQADSLLRTVLLLGGRARLDTSATAALEAGRTDVPAAMVQQPAPRYRGRSGHVLLQFIVGADGRAEPESIVPVIASDQTLVDDARAVVRDARFRSAEREGRPVRQRMTQVIVWRVR